MQTPNGIVQAWCFNFDPTPMPYPVCFYRFPIIIDQLPVEVFAVFGFASECTDLSVVLQGRLFDTREVENWWADSIVKTANAIWAFDGGPEAWRWFQIQYRLNFFNQHLFCEQFTILDASAHVLGNSGACFACTVATPNTQQVRCSGKIRVMPSNYVATASHVNFDGGIWPVPTSILPERIL